MARLIESSGFDSIWLSDHVVLVEGIRSRYPFSADGSFFAAADSDWLDWVTTAAFLAAKTEKARLAVGVCVVPLRHPLVLAKQIATLDQLSGGRVVLGVGAGWMAEEFDALGLDFNSRGAALDGGLRLMRAAWSGAPAAGQYGPYRLPEHVHTCPTPAQRRLPIYIGGDSPSALRRVAEYGDGWYGAAPGGDIDPRRIDEIRRHIADRCARVGRDPEEIELALRIGVRARDFGTPQLVARLQAYASVGVGRFSFDLSWREYPLMKDRLALLCEAVQRAGPQSR